MFSPFHRQTADVFDTFMWHFYKFDRSFVLRIHLFAERIQFIRPTKSNGSIGAPKSRLHSNDLSDFVAVFYVLRNSYDAVVLAIRIISFQVSVRLIILMFDWKFFNHFFFLDIFHRIRGTINGFVAGIYYTSDFVSKKIYYNLETTLSLAGVSLFYCIITGFGLILMYLIFPETNNRTIEDIELHFADDSKRITDWRVSKSQILVDDIKANDIENAKERWKVDEKVPLLQYQDKIQKQYISMSY